MDPIVRLLLSTLPEEIVELVQQQLSWLAAGDYASILSCDDARGLFSGLTNEDLNREPSTKNQWLDRLFYRLNQTLSDRSRLDVLVTHFCIGYAALLTFMQANVTGPPLSFRPESLLLTTQVASDPTRLAIERQALLDNLSCDGIAAYNLTTNIELLCVAQTITSSPAIIKHILPARWVKMRTVFMQQRLISEPSSTLESLSFDELNLIEVAISGTDKDVVGVKDLLLLERAVVELHYGHDKSARESLEQARKNRQFEYTLTGRLGRRTRYQQNDTSQLVVLAKSASAETTSTSASIDLRVAEKRLSNDVPESWQPKNLDLNDDTLLERIAFSGLDDTDPSQDIISATASKPDLTNQPQLAPLDSIILLSSASSITNTSPEYGLTREETLPYAVRVLNGGSSNWQIYTQALLVRSRIEGFSSRTIERGLLQLQALVDQIIAETSNDTNVPINDNSATTFLPKSTATENASVVERLQYVFQLASPMRWELEAELAARWIQLGGLRTALDIYERLQMWAETALCLAATEQEDRARKIVKRQLFEDTENANDASNGPPRQPPPPDAPRLYCILGDMDQSIDWYKKAWEVSEHRYARAQRSIGRLLFSRRDYHNAVDAYTQSLRVDQLNQQSWFALGCALIELERFDKAVEAFSRCVQLDDTDAESWSNLAAALLRVDTHNTNIELIAEESLDDDERGMERTKTDTPASRRQKNLINALKAFQRAATIKHDSYRIWQNILVTAASVNPPDYTAVLTAQKRIVDLRGNTEGEQCIDLEILEHLVGHIIANSTVYNPAQPGLARTTVKFMDEVVSPMVNSSVGLWRLASRLSIWRGKPDSALDYEEKAWRAATAQPGWELDNERLWQNVVEATVRLCDTYESLGPQEKTEGLAAGSGQLVASDWKFKARAALKSIMNKGRDSWEHSEGWNRLKDTQQNFKA